MITWACFCNYLSFLNAMNWDRWSNGMLGNGTLVGIFLWYCTRTFSSHCLEFTQMNFLPQLEP
jgi:hypothetical protein